MKITFKNLNLYFLCSYYIIGGDKIIFYNIVLSDLRWLENSDHDAIRWHHDTYYSLIVQVPLHNEVH